MDRAKHAPAPSAHTHAHAHAHAHTYIRESINQSINLGLIPLGRNAHIQFNSIQFNSDLHTTQPAFWPGLGS